MRQRAPSIDEIKNRVCPQMSHKGVIKAQEEFREPLGRGGFSGNLDQGVKNDGRKETVD